MKRSKPGTIYRGMSFPVPLIEEVAHYIQDKSEYRSTAEFFKEAVREKLHREKTLMLVCTQLPDKIICNGKEYILKNKKH